MDALQFDGYTSYSDSSSAPRTPSPSGLVYEPYVEQWHPMVRRATYPYVRQEEQYYLPYLPPFDDVKVEEPVVVPTQSPSFFRSPPYMPPPSYLPTGLPVQHTDDAASKETQYLRRRCFNCHTTEPPSWRRSTLNPGKIVCNKCGLYERTHLRPRPLRFDELRAGNKARKHASKPGSPKIKKEPLMRRASVSSTSTGNSDWDDSVSVYSSSSSFNSPSLSTFPLSRDSQSPPAEIKLPNNPLAELSPQQHWSPDEIGVTA